MQIIKPESECTKDTEQKKCWCRGCRKAYDKEKYKRGEKRYKTDGRGLQIDNFILNAY